MKNICILLLTTILAACAGRNAAAPVGTADGNKLTDPPAALMERKPLVNPAEKTPVAETIVQTEEKDVKKVVPQTKEQKISKIKAIQPDYVPYYEGKHAEASLPQLYAILASRTVNKMLRATTAIYNSVKSPTMYVSAPQNENPSISLSNLEYADKATKNIISASRSYTLTEYAGNADYTLDTYIAQNEDYNRGKPILSYRIILKNRDNKQIGTWRDTLSPISNDDQSWW